jgi:hypothetical protein
MGSKISESIFEKSPNISGLLHRYNDRFLADDSLSNIEVVILALYLKEQMNKKSGVSYQDLRELFTSLGRDEKNFKVAIFRAKKDNFVEEKNHLIYFLINGLKRVWALTGRTEKSTVRIFKSGETFTSIKLFEEFLVDEIKDKELLLSDSHISPITLYPFSALKGILKNLKILTSNIYELEKLQQYAQKLEFESGIKVEVRENFSIHDRWLICGDKCWSLGSSIKDLGNKYTVLSELQGVTQSLREVFQSRWNSSKVII